MNRYKTIKEVTSALKQGEVTARALTESYLEKIAEKNPELNAFLGVFTESALREADEADKKIKAKEEGALLGIPFGIKDAISIEGEITSSGSNILSNYRATYNATVVDRLKKAGAVLLGHTNMDEFAMGSSNENSAFGPVKNPHDVSKVAGGSSGGSAAAVASGMCLAALGSDTGGSVREPASFTGVVGLKPTYGAVSRYGLIALASSLDQIGPMTNSVDDAEEVFKVISGKDLKDGTTEDFKLRGSKNLWPKDIRIGVLTDFPKEGLHPEVLENFQQSISKLEKAGYAIENVTLPNMKYAIACYYILLPAEVSSNLARMDGVRFGVAGAGDSILERYCASRGEGFGPEVRRRVMLGTYVLSAGYYDAYYGKAQAVRELIRNDFLSVFKKVDALVLPTVATPAFNLGEKTNDPLSMYLADLFTIPANLAGVPAISVPTGMTRDALPLPLGTQVVASHFREDICFAVGRSLES